MSDEATPLKNGGFGYAYTFEIEGLGEFPLFARYDTLKEVEAHAQQLKNVVAGRKPITQMQTYRDFRGGVCLLDKKQLEASKKVKIETF